MTFKLALSLLQKYQIARIFNNENGNLITNRAGMWVTVGVEMGRGCAEDLTSDLVVHERQRITMPFSW